MGMISLLRVLVIIGMISCEDKGGVRLVVRVGEDVVLPCSLGPEVDIQPAVFDWTKDRQDVFLYNAGIYHSGSQQSKGRVSHFPDELKNGNASITIRNIQLPDSGYYSCFFPHLQQQRFNVELLVGVSPKPCVSILSITEDQALLQCEIRGAFPKPQISWLDSDGIVLPAEEKMEKSDGLQHPEDLMLQTTVTKSGIFRCRVAQKELNRINEVYIYAQIFSDKTVTGSNGKPIGLVLLSLGLIALILTVVLMVLRMCKKEVTVERLQAKLKAERSSVAESWDIDKSSLRSSDSLRNRHMKAVLEPKGFKPPQNNRTAESCDSDVSTNHSSDSLQRLQAKLKAERSSVAESCDIDKSSLRSSDSLQRHLAMLKAERSTVAESCDSGVSTHHSSDSLPESCDSGVSSPHSSDSPTATLQETGKPKLTEAPDETSEMIPEEMETM